MLKKRIKEQCKSPMSLSFMRPIRESWVKLEAVLKLQGRLWRRLLEECWELRNKMALQAATGSAAYKVPKNIRKQSWAKKKRKRGFKVKNLIGSKTRELIMKKYKLL